MTSKISALTAATAYLATDQHEINQSGTSKKITPTVMHPRARVDNNVSPFNNVAIPNNALTAVTFDHEVYDTGGLFTLGSPTSFTITQAGLYLITASIEWANTTVTGRRILSMYVNGTNQIGTADDGLTTRPERVQLSISVQYVLAAADYVEVKAYQTSGGSLNILQEDFYSPAFAIVMIGP